MILKHVLTCKSACATGLRREDTERRSVAMTYILDVELDEDLEFDCE